MKSAKFFMIGLLTVLLNIFSCTDPKNKQTIKSPDGKISLTFLLIDHSPSCKIDYNDRHLTTISKLGFEFKNIPSLTGNFRVTHTSFEDIDTVWTPVWGSKKKIQDKCREMTITLREKSALKRTMKIILRTYNDGAAFRYEIPKQKNINKINITSENTQFNFMDNHECWCIPADYDSYEHLYSNIHLKNIDSVNTPITMKSKNGIFISIHEANLTDYAGMTLKKTPETHYALKVNLVPWPDGIKVKTSTPMKTPWRTLQICSSSGDLITSSIILNLNEPCRIKDCSWISPMKYIGIWWGMHISKNTWHAGPDHGATTENALNYIDFAAANGIPALLIEGWNAGWETWFSGRNMQDYTKPYPDIDYEKIVRYGKKAGVEIIGHHETGGNIPYYEKQLSDAFTYYKNLGISTIKTGYAGKMHPEGMYHHGQWMVNHYREVLKMAAKYHIMIDAHEPIKATGISRTYPNMLTREGGRGMEYNAWSSGNPPEHTTILPFTRFLAGPMDYTPGIFDLYFNKYNKEYRVWTTLSKQLAYYVVLYSPLQMAADLIENYQDQPAFEFIRDVPVTWDDTRVIDSKIGDYLFIARKKGNEWYIGGITDEYPRQIYIPLDFLKKNRIYTADIYCDHIKTGLFENPSMIEIGHYSVNSADTLKVALTGGGGIALRIYPEDTSQTEIFPNIDKYNANTPSKIEKFNKLRIYGKPL